MASAQPAWEAMGCGLAVRFPRNGSPGTEGVARSIRTHLVLHVFLPVQALGAAMRGTRPVARSWRRRELSRKAKKPCQSIQAHGFGIYDLRGIRNASAGSALPPEAVVDADSCQASPENSVTKDKSIVLAVGSDAIIESTGSLDGSPRSMGAHDLR
ncbi:hypothetical protein N7492_002945 [Penicillium capsulatum]|uniref:Uncharacterized protein n=1 Tax=Penicillium capsulatum TaxID=69766 RepID=A0A9W9IJM9_9EURO|nr:hypothetical protein N7492_002945 [Penicillium capsulatum]